jgi:hypothetical protein
MLSRELVEQRIDGAHVRGLLTDDQYRNLRASNVFAIGEHHGGERQVCLAIGRSIFDEHRGGCEPLLS